MVWSSAAVAVPPPFDITDFVARTVDAQGVDYAVAGGRPHDLEVSFGFTHEPGAQGEVEFVKSTYVDSPPGFVANPAAAARCTMAQLQAEVCPAGSVIGEISLNIRGGVSTLPLVNMLPQRGYPAQLGFKFTTVAVVLLPRLRPRTGDYGVTVASPGIGGRLPFFGIKVLVHGVPSERNGTGGPPTPFLANPGDCLVAAPVTNMFADAWAFPGRRLPSGTADFGFPDLSDPAWKSASMIAPAPTNCDDQKLVAQFAPSLNMRPTPGTGIVASGRAVGLHR